MTVSAEKLNKIWEKTGGYCEYCGKRLTWGNYGISFGRGSWEVDHSLPISKGGTDHLNNLVPACTKCNRKKGNMTAAQFKKTFETEPENTLADLFFGIILVGGVIGFIKRITASR